MVDKDIAIILKNRPCFDWIEKAFIIPEIFINDKKLILPILNNNISNPVDAVKLYCDVYLKRPIKAVNKLYSSVFNNHIYKSKHLVAAAINVIKAAIDPEAAIIDIIHLTFKYTYHKYFNKLVTKALSHNTLINTNWSNNRIFHELMNFVTPEKVDYIGELILPNNFRLLTSHKELADEGTKQQNCLGNYWERVKAKECFIISINTPTSITVSVSLAKHMELFIIEEANGKKNSFVSRVELRELSNYLLLLENQEFFRTNLVIKDQSESYPSMPPAFDMGQINNLYYSIPF